MIRRRIAPEFLDDESLIVEYEASDADDDRAAALATEIQRHKLDM